MLCLFKPSNSKIFAYIPFEIKKTNFSGIYEFTAINSHDMKETFYSDINQFIEIMKLKLTEDKFKNQSLCYKDDKWVKFNIQDLKLTEKQSFIISEVKDLIGKFELPSKYAYECPILFHWNNVKKIPYIFLGNIEWEFEKFKKPHILNPNNIESKLENISHYEVRRMKIEKIHKYDDNTGKFFIKTDSAVWPEYYSMEDLSFENRFSVYLFFENQFLKGDFKFKQFGLKTKNYPFLIHFGKYEKNSYELSARDIISIVRETKNSNDTWESFISKVTANLCGFLSPKLLVYLWKEFHEPIDKEEFKFDDKESKKIYENLLNLCRENFKLYTVSRKTWEILVEIHNNNMNVNIVHNTPSIDNDEEEKEEHIDSVDKYKKKIPKILKYLDSDLIPLNSSIDENQFKKKDGRYPCVMRSKIKSPLDKKRIVDNQLIKEGSGYVEIGDKQVYFKNIVLKTKKRIDVKKPLPLENKKLVDKYSKNK